MRFVVLQLNSKNSINHSSKNVLDRSNITLKISKFQNEFMKSSFLQNIYEPNIVRISALYCATLQGRNLYILWFIFWEKRGLHKFILKFTDLY
jgi:hypothetical protein